MWILISALALLCTGGCFFYIANRLSRLTFFEALAGGKRWRRVLLGIGLTLLLALVLSLTMGYINAIICFIHLAVFWLIIEGAARLICRISRRGWGRIARTAAGCAAILFTAVYLAAGWMQAYRVWETDYAFVTQKEVGTLRIVQISDSHVGTTFDGDGFAKAIAPIDALEPDVVVVTGDFVDDDTTKENMIRSCEALGALHTKYGVYFVFGNHDKGYYAASHRGYTGDDLIAELEKNGVTVLQDESVLIDDRFYLIGRQDRSEENERGNGRASMAELVSGLDTDKYMVVLDHQPCDYDAQAESGVDLVLSGHTHGGQLIPLDLLNPLLSENDRVYGTETRGSSNFIVSSGISDWAIRFKTGCRSEYVVIDIENFIN